MLRMLFFNGHMEYPDYIHRWLYFLNMGISFLMCFCVFYQYKAMCMTERKNTICTDGTDWRMDV